MCHFSKMFDLMFHSIQQWQEDKGNTQWQSRIHQITLQQNRKLRELQHGKELSLQMINMEMSAAWDLGVVRLVCSFHKQPTLLQTCLCYASTSGLSAGWRVSALLFRDTMPVVDSVDFKWTTYK